MKCNRHTIKLTLAFFAMFALTACVNTLDEEDFKTTFRVEGGEECALFFKIETGEDDMDTRASGDLVNGSEEEYQIGENGNYAFFFYENGNFYKSLPLTLYGAKDDDCGEVTDNNPSGGKHKIEKIYEARFSLQDNNGELPTKLQCLVVLNGNPIIAKLSGNLNNFLKFDWEDNEDPTRIGRDGDLFTMTNSSYVDGGKVCCAVPIDVKELYTPIGVDELDPKKIVTIHVERMLSKFTFEIDESKFEIERDEDDNVISCIITPDEKTKKNIITYCSGISDADGSPILEERDFKIRVTGWGINALEYKTNVYKNITTTNYFTNWNDPANYRSYWGEDEHYRNHDYPWQFRKSNKDQTLGYYSDPSRYDVEKNKNNSNLLWNYPYSALNTNFGNNIYVPENTYDTNDVVRRGHDNREHVLAGTHLIIGAELLTDLDGDGTYEAVDLWRDRTGVYYSNPAHCFWSLVRSFNHALQSHVYMDFNRLNWGDGFVDVQRAALTMSGSYKYNNREYTGTDHSLYYNGTELNYKNIDTYYKDASFYDGGKLTGFLEPATITAGDGQVLPWHDGLTIRGKDDSRVELDIFRSITIEYDENDGMRIVKGELMRQADADDVKSMLYEWVGAVDHFKKGMMYYAAPAELTGAGGTANNIIYGVVRNGWYKYKLSDIQVVGTSVDNEDEPIVPNKVITHDQLNITVEIIDWHNFLNIVAPLL